MKANASKFITSSGTHLLGPQPTAHTPLYTPLLASSTPCLIPLEALEIYYLGSKTIRTVPVNETHDRKWQIMDRGKHFHQFPPLCHATQGHQV